MRRGKNGVNSLEWHGNPDTRPQTPEEPAIMKQVSPYLGELGLERMVIGIIDRNE